MIQTTISRYLNATRVVSRLVVCGVIVAASLLASTEAATLVHISVDRRGGTEYGAGFTVGREAECFIVTPLHVVQFATPDSITITDPAGRSFSARLIKESQDYDVALLQVTTELSESCPADWSNGANVQDAIGSAPFLIARKVDDSGRISQSRFFPSSTSREFVELEPYGQNDALREGDSGSSLFAGADLVGLVTSVDTRTGNVTAVTQSQIHALFGSDVLPGGIKRVVVGQFTYRRAENPYAAAAAREYVVDADSFEVVSPNPGAAPATIDADYVIAGDILNISRTYESNPDYRRPQQTRESDGLGTQLLRGLQERFNEEVDEAFDRNTTSRYIYTYSIDIQVQIEKQSDDSQILELAQQSIVIPDGGMSQTDMQNDALREAVKRSLESVFEKYSL